MKEPFLETDQAHRDGEPLPTRSVHSPVGSRSTVVAEPNSPNAHTPLMAKELLGETSQEQALFAILDEYITCREKGFVHQADFVRQAAEKYPSLDIVDQLPDLLSSIDALEGLAPSDATPRGAFHSSSNLTMAGDGIVDWGDLVSKSLGDYEIQEEMGRGGMGVVYRARQVSLNRFVALKVLPLSVVLDKQQVARFQIEAQAAGQLSHPNIVPIYWVGRESGVHCYSMQLIEGETLEKIIETSDYPLSDLAFDTTAKTNQTANVTPTIDECVGWMIQAAEALEHAHQHGVIHRDIKPSNLLVDQERQIWVTDFGLARCHRTTDLTHSRAVVGTYRYMSPEQASGHAATVDHRSDVYCLGVTFYELLTGKRVYQGDAADTGTNRRPSVDPKSPQILNRKIERDLATIVLKSLRISPDDRYESAQALADDLKRYRRGQPIMAKPPTPSDRFSKWVIRHHQLVAILVAVGILVVAASLAATSVFARQRQQLRAALDDASDHLAASERNLRLAKSNFRQTREVLDHFGLLAADRLRGVAGAEAIRETLVRDLLLYYERFVTSAERSPELDRELAQTHAKAGEIISEIGATSRAMKSFRSAIDLYQTQPPSDDVTYRLGVCRNHLAMLLAESGEPEKALETYVAAVDGLSSLELDDAEHLVTYARVHGNIGLLHANAGRDELAEQEYQRAIAILDGVEEPDEHCQMTVSMIWNNLGHLLQSTDLSGAIEYGDLAITTLRPLVVPSDRLDSISHTKAETYRALAMCLNNQGSMLMQVDDSEEAFSCFRESIGIFRDLVDRMPSVIRYTEELGVCYNNYGRALHRKQLPEQAEQALRRARDLMRWLAERQPNQHRYHQALEGVEQNLAMVVSGSMSVERSGSVGVDRE